MSADAGGLGHANPLDREHISNALSALHPSYRDVVHKAYYLGWTTGQIAADLHTSEPSVKRRLHDAVHALRRTFVDPTMCST